MLRRSAPSFVLLALAAGCAAPPTIRETPAGVSVGLSQLPPDVHSYARPGEARVTHVALDLDADFGVKELAGTATLTVARVPGARQVVLDTRDLMIERVTDADGDPLVFEMGAADPILGRPLTVTLPEDGDRVVVHYRTRPTAAAVQWLTPAQTSSGKPFLFTQGQAILTRTWVPTQDSPGIRQTYEAEITVPATLTAVMSAEHLTPGGIPSDGDRTTFRFRMANPIPPYLIALAIGDLAFRPVGERAGVWAEPGVVERAAYEFADMETMIDAAERLYGPYRWGRYDVLVLPPSFPFGGMENPRLTFATPTVLAGDRSLVSLIAHELAHSWSGNLVTNATWSDFWLNEGFTTYFENRIMEEVYGAPYAQMLEHLGRQGLQEELAGLPEADQRLHIDLAGRDPDAGMTAVAYDKGATFLRVIERAVGRGRFDAFLRRYFDEHAFQPMTTEQFLAYLDRELIRGDAALRARIDPEAWAYGPGLPANAPPVHAEAFARVEAQAEAFTAGTAPAALATQGWTTHEWLHFFQSIPDTLSADQLRSLDQAFRLSQSGNSEILFAWLMKAVQNQYEPALPAVERFLTTQGRRKFVRPLYQALAATDWGRPHAQRIYRQARPTYHAVTAGSIDAILGAPGGG
ncbi:MAG TPA: M1 family metallopeptidase [Rubricoccaceae bacterium]|nr:M1 family metallopeptidase [Rubricoccaceae bacterium]